MRLKLHTRLASGCLEWDVLFINTPTGVFHAWSILAARLALAALFNAGVASAGELQVSVSQTLSASPEEVWQEIGRFGQLSWHPAVANSVVRGNPERTGAVREITTVDGAVLVEKLVACSQASTA